MIGGSILFYSAFRVATWVAHRRTMSSTTRFLEVDGNKIAYRSFRPSDSEGSKSPITVLFFHGLYSKMTGEKATMLESACRQDLRSYVRFDFTACGESPGNPLDVTLSIWKRDALAVVDHLTEGPLVIVGSSLGAWLMLLVALERKNRIVGLLGLASAPDFMVSRIEGIDAASGGALSRDGFVKYPDLTEGPYVVSKEMLEDARANAVLESHRLGDISCPVRLIHGQRDDVVPFRVSLDLSAALKGTQDVETILRKDGDHRLSTLEDLELIRRTLHALCERILSSSPK